MVDERRLVIRDLLLRLAECGIAPEEPFTATWDPFERVWIFEREAASSSSSSSAGGTRGSTVQKR